MNFADLVVVVVVVIIIGMTIYQPEFDIVFIYLRSVHTYLPKFFIWCLLNRVTSSDDGLYPYSTEEVQVPIYLPNVGTCIHLLY